MLRVEERRGETGRDGERHDDSPSMIVKLLEREGSTRVEMMRLTRFLTLESLVFGFCSESFFFERGWIIFDSCFWIYIWQWITIHIVFFFLFIIYWKTFIILVFEYLWRVFVVFFLMYLFMKIIGEYFCFLFFEICRMILYNDNLFILCILKIDVALVWKRYFHFFHWIL